MQSRSLGGLILALILAVTILPGGLRTAPKATAAQAAEAPDTAESTQPTLPQKTFNAPKEQVWQSLLDILKAHELPVASADQTAGTISTNTKRYFKILSAKFPPVQFDYRDTYTIQVKPGDGVTTVQIERKFEVFDDKARTWVAGDPQKEAAGLSVEAIFNEVAARLTSTDAAAN